MNLTSKLRNIDLNLLVVFHCLVQEKNVTRAARTLGLTQPAVSNALSRLRDLFSDQLLVRTANGMILTAEAEALTKPVGELLNKLDQDVFSREQFNPTTTAKTFVIASTDYGGAVLGSRIVRYLTKEAPNANLQVLPLRTRNMREELESGELDVVLGFRLDPLPGLYAKKVLRDEFVGVCRKDHPNVSQRLTEKKYTELEHLLVAPWSGKGAVIDEILAKKKLSRRVTVRIPTFAVAPSIVASSDLMCALPRKIAEDAATHLPLKLLKLPFDVPPVIVNMGWHERTHNSSEHKWLRDLITRAAES